MSCKFEHRCLICNKWGHGAQNCRKVKGNHSVGRKRVNYAQSEDKKNDRYHYTKRESNHKEK